MAKGNKKLTKLKSTLKKMQSFKIGRNINCEAINNSSYDENYCDGGNKDLHPVYVGKSRRRYLVTSETIDHPLFRELVERSVEVEDSITVGCEVVMFEHMLWMLDNADHQLESLEELVEFYTC
ncbi:hypothetical protein LIER_34624 [Lithospermum erythrorhizon]|uniref:SAUR family protein n=1 Tax=Lithospermum erythrorhizon TaxID=34254 RepID=A0AAV3S400_LITER